MQGALIELKEVSRSFAAGEQQIVALDRVSLEIRRGEMVAIVGASGSGKSTLMNILGCLDRPSQGSYLLSGVETASLDSDELARLRREHLGFIFQRYHLLPHLAALQNVEIPAVYAGTAKEARRSRALELLERLGLADRSGHLPGQLSGGQQQRVSIARALMNGGEIILADEPTGALDSRSGREMMKVLHELHGQGHTIILVTHDPQVAANAERIIEIADGAIVRDQPNQTHPHPDPPLEGVGELNLPPLEKGGGGDLTLRAGLTLPVVSEQDPAFPEGDFLQRNITADQERHEDQAALEEEPEGGEVTPTERDEAGRAGGSEGAPQAATGRAELLAAWDRFAEAFAMAWIAMASHRLRTLLTMLGIVIGITAVVSVVAIGQGARQKVIADISSMGTNVIDIYPGKDWGDEKASSIHTLVPSDLDIISAQSYVDSVTPVISSSALLRYGSSTANASISGVGASYFRVRGMEIAEGESFDEGEVRRQAQVAVIDHNTAQKFFQEGESPVGKVIFLGSLPCRIIAVAKQKEGPFGNNQNLGVWIPYTASLGRLLGQSYLNSVTVRVGDGISNQLAEQNLVRLLTQRHGTKDFYTSSSDTILKTVNKTTQTLALLISSIAVISLVVGGIGVMNIMLVSVTERTHEIGIRIAVGARQGDIRQQFLIEAVLVCLVGGLVGILLSYGIGAVFPLFVTSITMKFSTLSIAAAFFCSSLIGVVFGFLPASNAARLDPIEALARE